MIAMNSMSEKQCTRELGRILESSSKVAVLLRAIQLLDKTALKRGVTCRPCKATLQENRVGYYDFQYKRVVLCCENIHTRADVEETLIHELVHAFDRARKGKFSSMCHLMACGEVRASALGQCADVTPESRKKECILRDAIRSTREHCGDEAERIVRQVYNKCVKDVAPFVVGVPA
ncbi:peptidase M76 [Phycomyces blakesleeanus]|uniref:Mitochondrial inner membrane protease ATP23 n=2 Tax=Phycomyces blakesleeanus TaxID=4837 RepID=A0A167K5L7_PHYB8|nr:hypothetical protein PHYBLDRAFT_174369 [Phycomyces blakesleeanus NRRL 1555(-)]OAD67328.1 hypothetical protein PHYBLDRAFT_174369 [Phycomyces blakesleeanus NRRL 1555(-)]|eukprot:XP_018285368.1 hypothetical protein PHYBLDRAFT_174369 [Phycomyces blakesleeanus NRRL 1555(-)]